MEWFYSTDPLELKYGLILRLNDYFALSENRNTSGHYIILTGIYISCVILKQLIFCSGGETIESDVGAVCEFASHIWVPCSGLV